MMLYDEQLFPVKQVKTLMYGEPSDFPKSTQIVSTPPGTGLESFTLSPCPSPTNIPVLLEFHGTNVSTMYVSFQNY